MASISEVVQTLSLIPKDSWPRFVEREAELLPAPRGWSEGIVLNLMVVCGLNDYQLKGRAEVAYWPSIRRLISSAPIPYSNADLIGMLTPFYAKERLPQTKLARLNRYLGSDLARETAGLSARQIATQLPQFHCDLAVTMLQTQDQKTIAFAMKCMILGLRTLGVHAVYPLPVPVDSRVRDLTQRMGLVGGNPSDEEIRACWAEVLGQLRQLIPGITMVDLDSFLWQGAKWRSPDEVAQWLVHEHGVIPGAAARIADLFYRGVGVQKRYPMPALSRGPAKQEDERMSIPFPRRSEFLPALLRGIRSGLEGLESGKSIEVWLGKPGGYVGARTVMLRPDITDGLEAEGYKGPADRFPRRIKVAAWALHLEGLYGRFFISHGNGLVTIRRI